MILKVETFLGGGSNGAKTTDFVYFCDSSHFSASRCPRNPPKLQKRCIWVFYNSPRNFKRKYWQEIFIL